MKRILIALIPILILMACNADPRPIVLGQDACHHCKMTLMDPKFGAELVTEKGKIFIFDDVNCMLGYMDSEEGKGQVFKHILVMDYLNPGTLLDANFAHYLKSPEFKTPMASEVVAFPDYQLLKEYKVKNGGVYLAWGELTTQFK
ncbi:MAG TPA: nitrous oxide reductase [Algoriphagus sp.]|jgi:copper chaperone NosL|uniref:Copper chaperone NosL n=1 Tax=Algoriphagus ornithinivorans TaxID=226506 RepID=A0A1I5AV87_9BACT|nr:MULTISPECIES: nitrous oxide reductase accessory protein NosL [Algoriphagus]MAL14786.1 nitrous oxide reductase [Algoriphagus sp.]MAN86112.1 nitrous oxide reductase [Algoriphagus sp.]QYH39481.1 nitrous oxide reductase [Algoriphagus sp. NBT04N3]SFN66345.1 copper chaperone NosL [Algoriphagus ornithinivorans]HAD51307.1 nitrous oxide reductase [Algoriphagus sp.]|tara:strand:- start:2882 stop:3316 length:435 start_codon:yes stop_codon:yes gene_type:complete